MAAPEADHGQTLAWEGQIPRRRAKNVVHYPREREWEERVAEVAEEARSSPGFEEATQRWARYAATSDRPPGATPVLSLDDYSEVPFVQAVLGVTWYQYRARLRAGEGDLYAVAAPPIAGYERYCRTHLGLGRSECVLVEPLADAPLQLSRAICADPAALGTIRDVATRSGGLLIHPYMSVEAVWDLAARLEKESGSPVRVVGPPPHVTRMANNKAELSRIVTGLLGAESLTATGVANDPGSIADNLRAQARRSELVALKMPSCASGLGNRIYRSSQIVGETREEIARRVERFLVDKEWDGKEDVLAVEWHDDVLESPSSQCWIPPEGEGEPIVEEVYEQFLLGPERVFEGAMLSSLPRRLRHDLMIKSWLICRVFQKLGYVGRCSFDALVVGPSLEEGEVKLVECNGRWGGTSMPMHLMKRVFGDFRRVPYKAQDYVDERLRGLGFADLQRVFDSHLYDRRTGRGRVLLYNVGGVPEHGKFDLVVTGRSFADVDRFLRGTIPRLIKRYVG